MHRASHPSTPAAPRRAALAACAVLLGASAQAQTTTWQYTAIADSSAEFASFSVPAINDLGQVAFVATFDDPGEGQTLYRYDGPGILIPVADTSGVIKAFLGDPDLNAGGVVSFAATLDDDTVSVFAGSGGALATIANTAVDGLTSLDPKPFISDTGAVVVVRGVRASDGARVILKGTGAAGPQVLLDSTGGYDPLDVAGINATGVVAFEAESGGGTLRGVYRTTDGIAVTPIAEAPVGGVADVQALDINNNGTVAFFSRDGAGTEALSVFTAGPAVVFADTTGPFSSFGPASVAESGATAFRGVFDLGLNAIFAGGTGLYEKATAVNDNLLGLAITGLDTGPQAVTNAGSFVFRASRANGTSGIYVAVPRAGGGGGGGGGSALDGLSLAALLLAATATRRRFRP
ncbi:MAG: hypothetical protein JNK40_10410 [Chromatiales bacterium]|nr:hypothetical protein [Chromatiales bacterium]